MGAVPFKDAFHRGNVIDLSSGNSRFGYILGGSNREDLYRFKLGRSSNLDITLNLLKTNVNLQLFNSDRRLIRASTQRGTASEEIFADLKPGSYFLRVYTKSYRFTRYQLQLMTDWAESRSVDNRRDENGFNNHDWSSNDWGNNSNNGNDWGDSSNSGSWTGGMGGSGAWVDADDDLTSSDDPAFDPTLNEPLASIVLTSPNGKDMLASGSPYAITWSSDTNNLIKIELLKGDSLSRTIAGMANSGSYFWTVPVGLVPASDYRIRLSIVDSDNYKVTDVSDQFFTINK